jgi:predicted dehydrogenase
MVQPVRIGMVGLGGFGQFVLNAFAATPEVQVVAVHDVDQRVRAFADQRGLAFCGTYAELVANPDVEVVYLATPPALHGPAILQALHQGKHVFVEKPLATSQAEAADITQVAAANNLRVGIDYVLRFNPIYRLAVSLGRSGLLGELRHMTLENDAADEGLPPQHWFWNPLLSGTILVEHGVHFFDIAAQLAGAPGTYEYSQSWLRPVHGFQDRVLTVARYGDVPATFYHAFDKPGRIERTEFRLAYDLGYMTVKGWMPVELEIDAMLSEAGADRLNAAIAGEVADMGAGRTAAIRSSVETLDSYAGAVLTRGRGIEHRVDRRVRLRVDCPEGKQAIYARTIQAGVADFARALRDPSYAPEVTLEQAVSSLALALVATEEAETR